MTRMRLKIFWNASMNAGEDGYAWDLISVRKRNPIVILGRAGFKTVEAARKNAHEEAFKHNISIAKQEDIRE